MTLPEKLKPYFPSHDLSDLDREADQRLIITNILNFGDTEAIAWLLVTYERADLIDAIRNPTRGSWTERSLNYWRLIFDVELDRVKAERALMDATPRPEVYSAMFI